MSVTRISRPKGIKNKDECQRTIVNVSPIASYNWLDVPSPTILVPGSPPIWSPPSNPRAIAPDEGFSYIDQNADRYPKSPLAPIFSSVLQMDPSFQFDTIDIVSDRSPLRKLYAFAAHDPELKDFRFGISVFGRDEKKMVVFHRMEKMTREEHEEGGFHGYRAGFEAQYLRTPATIKGGSHYQILEYEFGGLKFLVRSGVDGSLPNVSAEPKDAETEDPNTWKFAIALNDNDEEIAKGKGKSKAENRTDDDQETLTVVPTRDPVPPRENLLELATRSKFSKHPFNIATKMPDLYLSQTANYVEAYHHAAGYRRFLRDKTPGRFALADMKIRSLPEGLKKWEKDNGEVLGRYLKVLKEILDVVGRGGRAGGRMRGVWELRYSGEGEELEVREAVGGGMVAMGEGIAGFFGDGGSE
ncbi:MAG: hypothetical protein Q9223_005041 [Gallowayella weberi]